MSGSTLFQDLGKEINVFLDKAADKTVTDKIDTLGLVIASCVLISIIYQGLEVMYGRTQEPMRTILWNIFTKAVICSICLGGGAYIAIITDAFKGLNAWAGGGDLGLYKSIDSLYGVAHKISDTILKNHEYVGGLYALLFWAGFLIGLLPAFFTVLGTSLTLSILILVFPLAFICFLYKQTRQISIQWFNLFLANVFTVFFVGLFMKIVTEIMSKWIVGISGDQTIRVIFQMFVIGLTMGSLLSLAKGLAQGLAQVSFDTAVGSAIGSSMRGAGAVAGGMGYAAHKYGQFLRAPGANGVVSRMGQAMGRSIGKRLYRR